MVTKRGINKSERRALEVLSTGTVVPSTSEVYLNLARMGLARNVGLVLASRGSRGTTYKAGYVITDAGRLALQGGPR